MTILYLSEVELVPGDLVSSGTEHSGYDKLGDRERPAGAHRYLEFTRPSSKLGPHSCVSTGPHCLGND